MNNFTRKAGLIVLLLFACIVGYAADGSVKDFKVDLTNGNLLTSTETSNKSAFEFGIAVADDGTVSRVESGASGAVATLSGKFHSNEHGWTNFKAVVAVTGPVKISMGTCAWGGTATVKNSNGETVATMNTNTHACYHNDKEKNIVSCYYKGSDATTLTISGGNYVPYFAIETADASELKSEVNVTFSLGDATAEGVLPASAKAEVGSAYIIPLNRTLYAAGKTLTAWTDGTNNYAPGSQMTVPDKDVALTPVFTDNTVSLADRTEEVTLNFDFQRKNGAPLLAYQNVKGIYVTQATVNGQTIDSKLDFNTAAPGKIANGGWTDWCQMNGGTTLTVPSAQNAVVSIESYEATTTTTIDGQTDYTTSGKVVTANVASKTDSIDIVIGDGSFFRYVKIVLPVPAPKGKTYTDEAVTVEYPFEGTITDPATITPEDAVSLASFTTGDDIKYKNSASAKDKTYALFQPVSGAGTPSDAVRLEWSVKPAKGLTFTPTKVSANVQRFGTDGGNFDVKVANADGTEQTLATGLIAPRNNKDQAADKHGQDAAYTPSFNYDVPSTLASSEGFKLIIYVYGLGNTKQFGVNDVKITGTVSGTLENVEKFAFSAVASPAEGGSVKIYPAGDEFESGTELKLTATKNFGYKFVNWTDGDGKVLSTDEVMTYTISSAASLKANFEKINTYSLTYSVEGGAKDYMVSLSPEPTVVDGKNMYDEGTKVTVTATGNDILTFTNWSTGETSSSITYDMTEDKTVTANFSAVDYVAAWDFYKKGNNGRAADFASEDNDADQLVLRDADGTTTGWLDKSQENGGYEGRPAGVNWRNDKAIGTYYWQTKVDATNFTDLKVKSAMMYNYNAYQTYKVQYSLDGDKWSDLGSIVMPGVKAWTDSVFDVPSAANNQSSVYFRWIADKTSSIDGTKSDNDGNAIGAIYILGTAKIVDDGTAPTLVSTIPVEKAINASANGRVVLTFDEKVKLADGAAATLDGKSLQGIVSGKTITFQYKGLKYSTNYTFTLPANSVSDLTDNKLAEAVTINFTTLAKATVSKQLYDFVIPDDGTFREAIAAANSRKDKSARFRIFVKKGSYEIPFEGTSVGSDGITYPATTTTLTADNVSIIGEDRDATVLKNKTNPVIETGADPLEGIGHNDLLQISGSNTYLEDITLRNGSIDATGRNLAVQDKGDKTIYKNTTLYGYQDTWTSNNSHARYYFEDGVIRGRTDYICGKGDAFFNGVTFSNVPGGYIAVPSQPKKYGWILSECTIKGEGSGDYTLGRPWGQGTPIALWINCTMDPQPSAIGWNEMGNGWPARFAEYGSKTSTGTLIDLSGRKKTFGDNHANDPVLTAEEASQYTIATVMGGDDNWDPQSLTEQASAPENVEIDGTALTWTDNDYALLWAVCKNGSVVGFTTEPAYTVDDATATWSVRAANEMGGLGEATVAVKKGATGITEVEDNAATFTTREVYTLDGRRIAKPSRGVNIIIGTKADGTKVARKVVLK